MIKKLIYILILGAIGFWIFMPHAIEQTKEEFEAAGVTNTSILDFMGQD